MNERIFELAEQAENYATTRHPVSNIALSVNNEKFVKKFAGLIVQECMGIISDESEKVSDEWRCKDGKHIWWKIKEHFGVEE